MEVPVVALTLNLINSIFKEGFKEKFKNKNIIMALIMTRLILSKWKLLSK